jgi:hypothetical protein
VSHIVRPSWQLAPILEVLLGEIDTAWPARSRALDGTIGDADHQSRQSDHNPDRNGYVRALDITQDVHHGPPMDHLAELIRRMGQADSQRLLPGGYVVWNRRIASTRSGWLWRLYMGPSPHTGHLHVSVSQRRDRYIGRQPWDVGRLLLPPLS